MTTHNEQHNKTHSSKTHSKPRTPRTSVRLALPAFSGSPTLLTVLAVLVLGSAALALSCAPASVSVDRLQVSTYYSNVVTETLPVELGQAIADDGAFALVETDAILTISNLMDGDFTIHFGSVGSGGTNEYEGESYLERASNSSITIRKSDLAANSFGFTDGSVIGISELDSTDIQHVATYRPSNIYGSQDLQAMRKNLDGVYLLKQNIVFIPMTDDTDTAISNYEAVGDDINSFTGSLDGSGYTISGIQIEGTDTDNYQGLFGVMVASSVDTDTMAAQNLVLRDFKITANAYVGSLAGWIKKGTVDNVHVEVSNADTGKVEASGVLNNRGNGGGLLGSAGTDSGDTQVRIQNTSSKVAVSGTGASSNQIGGLVGNVGGNAILTESYATGSATGTENVGGLVGINRGTVIGYATGLVKGNNYVGGLVGSNVGTVTGYATGSVSGSYYLGGLLGTNVGTSIGYATGSVAGDNYSSGGLIGLAAVGGTATGYARGIVRRTSGTNLTFGKVVGQLSGGTLNAIFSSSSMSESKVYDGETGTAALAGTSGKNGTEVDIASAMQDTFDTFDGLDGFTFGTALSQWTWVEDGRWPAINIGEVKPAADQPIDPIDP